MPKTNALKKKSTAQVVVTFRLPPELMEEVRKAAHVQRRTISNMVAFILENGIMSAKNQSLKLSGN